MTRPTGNNPSGTGFGVSQSKTSNQTVFQPKGVVFSSKGSFNPTSLAIEESLQQDLFNLSMETMVVEQLRLYDPNER